MMMGGGSTAGGLPPFILFLHPMSYPLLSVRSPAPRVALSSYTERCSTWEVLGLGVRGAVLTRKGLGLGVRRAVLNAESFGAKAL